MPSITTSTTAHDLADDRDLLRYARQLILPQWSLAAQEKLLHCRVLIVGLGGLGCPAAQYLLAAGVVHLTLCDGDRVELSNLPRQILYGDGDLGKAKVEAARQALERLDPAARIETVTAVADAELLDALIPQHDLVLDCTDNFAARYDINRAARRARKPLISAAALRWEGQLAVFDFRRDDSACYACLYPEMDADSADSCATSGVPGPVPGILGSLQALEALRLLLGQDSPLSGRLLILDLLHWEWRNLGLRRDPACPVCTCPV